MAAAVEGKAMSKPPRITLIHATPIAMDPIRLAFSSAWPEADVVNLLEDSLSPDRARQEEITDVLMARTAALTAYAREVVSDAVLFTCSAFGRAIEQAATTVDIPVLKPNEAMFEAAIRHGGRTAMLYTFPPARAGMEAEFREEAARMAPGAVLESFLVDGAIEAVRAGDVEIHNRLVASAAAGLEGFESIVLAHFSTARAVPAVRAVTDIPVLSSPDAAIDKLKRLLGAA